MAMQVLMLCSKALLRWLLFRGVTRMAQTSGCALSGFVLVKKVPGSMHFLAKSPSHTFDYNTQNLSHVVNYFCAPPAAPS